MNQVVRRSNSRDQKYQKRQNRKRKRRQRGISLLNISKR